MVVVVVILDIIDLASAIGQRVELIGDTTTSGILNGIKFTHRLSEVVVLISAILAQD